MLGDMTGTTTVNETQKTDGAIDPMMAALGLGGAFLGNRLLKGLFSDDEGTGSSVAAPTGFTPQIKPLDLGSTLNIGGFATNFATDVAQAAKASTTGPGGQQFTGGGNEFMDALTSTGISTAVSAIGNLLSGLFSGASTRCFITTAVCKYFGKADDCHELTVLREFRDTFMQMTPERKAFIQQYYEEAPAICEAIAQLPEVEQEQVYTLFYTKYLLPAIAAVMNKEGAKALEIYTELFYAAKDLANTILATGE
jgi:hypothetical protein